jgi:hypothetical protein
MRLSMPGMAGTEPASSFSSLRCFSRWLSRIACARSRPRARGEAVGAFAGQEDVRRVGHRARQQDRVAHVAHAGDRAEAAARVHDRGVHFDGGAVQAQHRAGAGVEAFVFFEHDARRRWRRRGRRRCFRSSSRAPAARRARSRRRTPAVRRRRRGRRWRILVPCCSKCLPLCCCLHALCTGISKRGLCKTVIENTYRLRQPCGM